MATPSANQQVVTQQPRQAVAAARASAGGQSCQEAAAAAAAATNQNCPYPQYAPVTFFYLTQTARPRSWCLKIVSSKYPTHSRTHTQRDVAN